MKVVYLAHAIGPRDEGRHSRLLAARELAHELLRCGFAVIFPGAWGFVSPFDDILDYREWMAVGLVLIERCDGLVRMPGVSPGADEEVAHAMHWGIPVYDSVDALLAAEGRA